MTASSARRPTGHIGALDGLRGLAILLVLAEHFVRLQPTTPLERLIASAAKMGWIGVDLFFVLSGFLITGILLEAKGGEHYFRNFYLRRALRIFPLYYGCLILTFLVVPRLHLVGPVEAAQLSHYERWYWSYLANVLTARVGWDGTPPLGSHFWSLAIEEQFYLVWPLWVWLIPERRLKFVCVSALVSSFAIRMAFHASGEPGVVAYVLTPTHIDPLAVGAWLAAVSREPAGIDRLASRIWPAFALAVAVIGGIAVTSHGKIADSLAMASIGYPALAIGCAAALIGAVVSAERSLGGRLWRSTTMRYLGRRSYALYVLHPLLLFTIVDRGFDLTWFAARFHSQLAGQAAFAAMMVVLAIFVAELSWYSWEQPFLRLKRLFPMDHRTSDTTADSRAVPAMLVSRRRPPG